MQQNEINQELVALIKTLNRALIAQSHMIDKLLDKVEKVESVIDDLQGQVTKPFMEN